MKEISYKHAEYFAVGELKHRPLGSVTKDTPVFANVTSDGESPRNTTGNIKEVEARNSPVVAVTHGARDVERYSDHLLKLSETHLRAASVVADFQLQPVAYHEANRLGRSIDKPGTLMKGVTVE